ncbi:MAG: ATP-binding protein [Cyanobacteria bacterium P01_E01_bin.42]
MIVKLNKSYANNRGWKFIVAIAIIIPVAILGIEHLHRSAERLVRNGQDILRLQAIANRLDALEWRAISARAVESELEEAIAENREQAKIVMTHLQEDRSLSESLQRVESAYQTYEIAVDKLLTLLKNDDLQEALEVDENEVDPSFEELHAIILAETESFANLAANFKLVAFWGVRLIGLFLTITIVVLLRQFSKVNQQMQRMIAENAERREQVLQQEQQVLEEKIAERTRTLHDTNQQLEQALSDLQDSQLQVIQNEKMATLGNLVAGVAHEINNPVGFINGNISAAREHLQDLLTAFTLYQQEYPTPSPEFAEELEELDIDFIRQDFLDLITSMQPGIDRIAKISASLRIFSRSDVEKKISFDVHEGIDSSLLILKYRLKANDLRPEIRLLKDYGDLQLMQGYPGPLNQVFRNIFANAIDAIDEICDRDSFRDSDDNPFQICIKTEQKEKKTIISISDNGRGMSEATQEKMFEQGFTTKGVGKGTGLGMAIARQIIEDKHGGAISCHSKLGQGTEFLISLPWS